MYLCVDARVVACADVCACRCMCGCILSVYVCADACAHVHANCLHVVYMAWNVPYMCVYM